nr:hypothetical protein [uncultured Ruminococcus sp.]
MSNFDFDKYKNSYDKVTVSDERKEEIIALMKEENNSTVNGTKPQSQNKVITFKRAIVLVASVVTVILLAIFLQNSSLTQNNKDKKLDNSSITVSLSDDKKKKENKEYKITEKDTIIPLENNGVQIISKDGGNTISLNSLYFNIKGSEIDYIDVSSENDNSIICTYADDEDNLTTEFNSNYQKLKLQNINDLGWIVSEKNASSSANISTSNSASRENASGNKYFSDTVVITLHYKNGESVTKNIEIKFDNDNNVIVGYEK